MKEEVVFDQSGIVLEGTDGCEQTWWAWAKRAPPDGAVEMYLTADSHEGAAYNRAVKPFNTWHRNVDAEEIKWPFTEGKRYRIVIYELTESPPANPSNP
jgi:hypothetical protein